MEGEQISCKANYVEINKMLLGGKDKKVGDALLNADNIKINSI
jgi:hypothetical protein